MFCIKCGAELPNNSNFCPNCGQAISSQPTSFYVITIRREKQWFAINPAITIAINNDYTYKLENEESITVSLPTGKHSINLSCGIRNTSVTINVTHDLILNVKFNRLTGGIEIKEEL